VERFGLFASYNSDGSGPTGPPYRDLLWRIAETYFSGERLPSRPVRQIDLTGTYWPARRVDSNLFKLRGLLGQLAVRQSSGRLTIGPAFLPVGEPLDEIEPGLFRSTQYEVSFAKSGSSVVMQVGAPVVQLIRVQWWANGRLVAPALAACLIVAGFAVLWWPVAIVQRRKSEWDPMTRRLSATRLALLLNIVAIVAASWLVFWGWPLAAVSAPLVLPLGLGIYASAWTAVVLTPIAIWHAVRFTRTGGLWAKCRELLLAAVVVMLTSFCLYWRIAGMTVAF
jgi:hypothetical protein